MSFQRLELGTIKYSALEKLANLANKAQSSKQFIDIMPKYEKVINAAVQEHCKQTQTIDRKPKNIPLFTNKNGTAVKTALAKKKLAQEKLAKKRAKSNDSELSYGR